MKLAILSDIHGNYVAFKDYIDYIAQNYFDGVVLLGDYITDCPYPQKKDGSLHRKIIPLK